VLLEGLHEVKAKRADDFSLGLQIEDPVRVPGGDMNAPFFQRREGPAEP